MTNEQKTLQKAIDEYNEYLDFSQSEEYISLRNEFLEKFPIKSLETITIEQYALGLDDTYKDSFCYWIETKLQMFGDIHGSTAAKFGVYFGKRGDDVENKWRWTAWTNESFDEVRNELNYLIMAGNDMDFDAIEKNRLSKMFKGKILAVYFPDRYLNIYSYEHVKYFLKQLGVVEYPPVELAKQKLLEIKNSNGVMRAWNNLKFSNFLYTYFSEVKRKDAEEINEETPEIIGKTLTFQKSTGEYRAIEQTQSVPPNKNETKHKPYKPDYQKASEYKQKTGREGEIAVLDFEKETLAASGRQDLADKVTRVSEYDDSLGYDILSFDPITGKEKHIEVKTTSGTKNSFVDFYITDNELQHLADDSCYSIYYITGIYGNNPKIKELNMEQLRNKIAELSSPVLYKVSFSESD